MIISKLKKKKNTKKTKQKKPTTTGPHLLSKNIILEKPEGECQTEPAAFKGLKH